MNLFDLGMLLIAQEESPIAGLKTSIDNLNTTINQAKPQKVTAPVSTSAKVGKTQYFTQTKENFITSGTLYSTTKNVTFKLFKITTPVEWKNLSIYINNELYIQGDYAYYDDIGLAYFNPDKDTYIFHLEDEEFVDGIKVTIDKGIEISLFNIIGKIKPL